jgi:hypothetical protein
MYKVMFLKAGTERSSFDEYIIQGIQQTPFEPREGRTYRFHDRGTRMRGTRFTVDTVIIDQEWEDPENAVARVYLRQEGQ